MSKKVSIEEQEQNFIFTNEYIRRRNALMYDRIGNTTLAGYILVIMSFILHVITLFLDADHNFNIIGVICTILTLATCYLGESAVVSAYYNKRNFIEAMDAGKWFFRTHIPLMFSSYVLWILSVTTW